MVSEGLKGIFVANVPPVVFVRVVGRGTFENSQPLFHFAEEMIERGQIDFIVDLKSCQGMDSTFLGVLAGIALRLHQNGQRGSLRVVNPGERNDELLRTLGLDRLFDAGLPALEPPADAEFQALPEADSAGRSKLLAEHETARMMLEAHENLIRADACNQQKFENVTSVLRERIDRQREEKKQDL